MFINEYGDKNNPLFLLLAPMMISGEDLYQLMHPYFERDYHYIAPDQGGHGKAGAYISADMAAHPKEYAEEIEAFIRRNRNVLG